MAEPAQIELPPRLDTAARARRHVRSWMVQWGLEELVDPALLLTSELVTNALLHAGTTITVCVERAGEGVRVEVGDGSAVPPVRRRHSDSATTGRGVQLLDSLADDWGYQTVGNGKIVWFHLVSVPNWVDPVELEVIDL